MLVDGYNVIHADPELKRSLGRSLERARRGLIEMLAGYLMAKRIQVTVVFDGRGGITDVDVEIPGRLQVLYSASGQSADELIVGLLEGDPNPRQYVVVTSDMADIGRAARSLGAGVLGSREFLARIRRQEGPRRNGANDEPELGDVDYWLERFSRRDDEG